MLLDNEFDGKNICEECGGKCCRIYLGREHGGAFPSGMVYFEHWCLWFHEGKDKDDPYNSNHYGIKPLFDPLIVHQTKNKHMIEELKKKGIDATYCQYRDKNGCMIPRNKRPVGCNKFICEEKKHLFT